MSEFSIKLKHVKRRCFDPVEKFFKIGEVFDCPNEMKYIYKDNGSNILAVAHLDSVRNPKNFFTKSKNGLDRVFVETVDDRLGAYIILDILPQLGIVPDILLTEGEEIGQSTAEYFKPNKDYHWMFSFDREGTDVVMYEYENKANIELMEDFGFMVGFGSFSDICYLEHLDISGFNFGTGYYRSHSKDAHFVIQDVREQVVKFVKFHDEYKNTIIPYNPEPRAYLWSKKWDYSAWDYQNDKWQQSNRTSDDLDMLMSEYCPFCDGDLVFSFATGNIVDCTYCKERFSYHPELFGSEALQPIGNGDYCDICYMSVDFKSLTPIDSGTYVCSECLKELECCDFCGDYSKEPLAILDEEYPICELCLDDLYGQGTYKKINT